MIAAIVIALLYVFRLWNVLDGKKEQERILYTDEDPINGFLLNVDTKWRSHPNCEKVPKDQWATHEGTPPLYTELA
jgi:m7GpppX diphosphatase